jgi:hypothetical protein
MIFRDFELVVKSLHTNLTNSDYQCEYNFATTYRQISVQTFYHQLKVTKYHDDDDYKNVRQTMGGNNIIQYNKAFLDTFL